MKNSLKKWYFKFLQYTFVKNEWTVFIFHHFLKKILLFQDYRCCSRKFIQGRCFQLGNSKKFSLSFKQILLKESRKVNLKLNYLSQFWLKLENEYILNSEVLLKIEGFISIFYIGQSTFIACNPYVWIPKWCMGF